MNLHQKLLLATDRVLVALLIGVVLGGAIGFGGGVWWFRPLLVTTTLLLVSMKLIQYLIAGRMPLLKSPLTPLGLLVLGLGVVQLAPLPERLARRISPVAQQAYSRGVIPTLAQADDSEASLPEGSQIRSPATLDRSATLRWMVSAAACLGLFWGVSHFTDRLGRLYLVWGLVVAGFLLNVTLAIVQISCHSEGLYGLFMPGSGSSWAPSLNDLLESPTMAALRNLPENSPAGSAPARVVLRPLPPFLFGTMLGGGGTFLALGSLALPLALAITLHLISPRGSRESLAMRLGHSGQGSLVLLLMILLTTSCFLLGMISGPWYCMPLVVGLATAGLPAGILRGTRGWALGTTSLLLLSLGLGVALQAWWSNLLGGHSPVSPPDLASAQALWGDSIRIIREFPMVGSGLGSFSTIHAYFKDRDLESTTAMSSLLQWAVETGAVGLGILALAGLWCLIRLPGGVKRVGWIDRPLAFGLIGAALSFTLLSLVHWTLELPAVAISASALGGTWNRWLAGGTDLFVERG